MELQQKVSLETLLGEVYNHDCDSAETLTLKVVICST